MIIDLERFIDEEKRYWTEVESILDKLDRDPLKKINLSEVKRLHYLYQRTSSDLARVMGFSTETEIRRYLESLVGRAYAEVHELRKKPHRFSLVHWFFHDFPQTFRQHIRAFVLALGITAFGFSIGGVAVSIDKEAKSVILPFSHLQLDPSKRVAYEEKTGAEKDRLAGRKATFSAFLMTHNTRVSLFTFAMVSRGALAQSFSFFTTGSSWVLRRWILCRQDSRRSSSDGCCRTAPSRFPPLSWQVRRASSWQVR